MNVWIFTSDERDVSFIQMYRSNPVVNIPTSGPLCTTALNSSPVMSFFMNSVLLFNSPLDFEVKINPLFSIRIGQPFRMLFLPALVLSKFSLIVFSSLCSCPTVAFRVVFSLCSIRHSWVKMLLIFLVASRAKDSTIKSDCWNKM